MSALQKKILFIAVITAISSVLLVGVRVMAAPDPNAITESTAITFTPEIPIPGIFSGLTNITSTSIGTYIRAIFIFFIWSVGILATVMVIYGGIKWVAAAGNPGRINDARDVINNAIIGVLIALSSVVLLNTINPNLVNFKGISTGSTIEKIPFEADDAIGENGEGLSGRACTTKKGNPITQEVDCAANQTMIWPISGVAQVVKSRVGRREVTVGSSCHPGTDFTTDKKTGLPLLAVVSGVISKLDSACGESIITLATPEFHVRYVHVQTVSVSLGQRVSQGAVIGTSGGDPAGNVAIASCSTGAHLHLELYDNSGELHDIYPCIVPFVEKPIPGGQSQF